VIVCAYAPTSREQTAAAEDVLKEEAYLVVGWTPAEETLRAAEDRATAAGALKVRTFAVDGPPVDVLRPRSPSTAPTCSLWATKAWAPCPDGCSARCRPRSRGGPGWTC